MLRTYKLAHITDLADLSEEDAALFVKELPSIFATLRLLKANADGAPLSEVLPHLTYAPDIGDQVVMRAEGKVMNVPGVVMVEAERRNADATDAAADVISQARRRPRP
jgi:hypothetical protein